MVQGESIQKSMKSGILQKNRRKQLLQPIHGPPNAHVTCMRLLSQDNSRNEQMLKYLGFNHQLRAYSRHQSQS
jgi:hypothetical protein